MRYAIDTVVVLAACGLGQQALAFVETDRLDVGCALAG